MASTTTYKVGTISKILASQSSDTKIKTKEQLKLEALFGGNSSQVFRTVKVSKNQVLPSRHVDGSEDGTGVKKEKNEVVNVKEEVENVDISPLLTKSKKLKKKLQNSLKSSELIEKKIKKEKKLKTPTIQIQDTTVTTTTTEVKAKKIKSKKKKAKGKLVSLQSEIQNDDSNTKVSDKDGKRKKDKKISQRRSKNSAGIVSITDMTEDDENIETEADQQQEPPEKKTLAERNAPKPKDNEKEQRTIFVGNLPGDTLKKDLIKIMKPLGKLETARLRCAAPDKPTTLKKVAIIKREHHPDKATIAGFARFSSREEAKAVVEKAQGMIFKDHHLIFDLAVPDRKKDPKKGIFVGNLDFKLTEEELWRFFEDCGTITSVRIVRDGDKGMGKGFGFVNFQDAASINEALQKDNSELRNRPIRIKKCVKKLKVKKSLSDPGKQLRSNPNFIKREKIEEKFDPRPRRVKTPVVHTISKKNFRVTKRSQAWAEKQFVGDKLAEIGKLKRKSKKPNRGELRKNKFAKMLSQDNPKRERPKGIRKKLARY